MPTRGRAVGFLISVWILFAVFSSFSAVNNVQAYSVRYVAIETDVGALSFDKEGLCPLKDPSAHTMMPKKESFNTLARAAYTDAGYFKSVPIGGGARQAACLDQNCTWQFDHGLYYHNELTFFLGIIFNGIDKTRSVPDVFNNFERGVAPVSWYDLKNISYWGKRQPCMNSNGTWSNVEINYKFSEWICEYYEYDKSDYIFFPTFPNGDPIVPSINDSKIHHCGKLITFDHQGRWIYQPCKDLVKWYIGCSITVGATIAFIILIVLIIYLIQYIRRKKKEKRINRMLSVGLENPARIPTQSQINMSQYGSMHMSQMNHGNMSGVF
ncbi:unnamed protein product [Phytomonas sp. Hart1]|nr:unnamed protein product [Phytomonas sp. Hart1]|eukprot:CCW67216.1 unnamed protein product [Phytomonas sp. isolate Hart1]